MHHDSHLPSKLMIMSCSGHRLPRMIVLNNTCDRSDSSHGYFICIQLNWRVDRLEWCHHYQRVEQYGDMTACYSSQDSIIQSFLHATIQLFTDSFHHLIIQLCCGWLFDHSIIQSFNQSIIGSLDHWIFPPVNHPIIRLFNHLISIIRFLDHSIIWSMDYLITWFFEDWL